MQSSPNFQVWIMPDRLRFTGAYKAFTCETEIHLKTRVEGVPDAGVGFSIFASRLFPFFYHIRRAPFDGPETPGRRLKTPHFDFFEFDPADQSLIFRKGDSYSCLATQPPFAPEPLPPVSPELGTPILSMKTFAKALSYCLFVNNPSSKSAPGHAHFEGGVCAAMQPSRAMHFASEDLAGLSFSVPLNSSPKLVAMTKRMKDPCRLQLDGERALLDDGSLRCCFPVGKMNLPLLNLQDFIDRSANSSWTMDQDPLLKLTLYGSIIASARTSIDLKVVEDSEGSQSRQWLELDLRQPADRVRTKIPLSPDAQDRTVDSHREDCIFFRDLSAAVRRLETPVIGIRVDERAVILRDEVESGICHFIMARVDPEEIKKAGREKEKARKRCRR